MILSTADMETSDQPGALLRPDSEKQESDIPNHTNFSHKQNALKTSEE